MFCTTGSQQAASGYLSLTEGGRFSEIGDWTRLEQRSKAKGQCARRMRSTRKMSPPICAERSSRGMARTMHSRSGTTQSRKTATQPPTHPLNRPHPRALFSMGNTAISHTDWCRRIPYRSDAAGLCCLLDLPLSRDPSKILCRRSFLKATFADIRGALEAVFSVCY